MSLATPVKKSVSFPSVPDFKVHTPSVISITYMLIVRVSLFFFFFFYVGS